MKLAGTFFLGIALALSAGAQQGEVSFAAQPGRVQVKIGGQVIATYVYEDKKIQRPFFETLKTPDGIQVTRNHPPVAGKIGRASCRERVTISVDDGDCIKTINRITAAH